MFVYSYSTYLLFVCVQLLNIFTCVMCNYSVVAIVSTASCDVNQPKYYLNNFFIYTHLVLTCLQCAYTYSPFSILLVKIFFICNRHVYYWSFLFSLYVLYVQSTCQLLIEILSTEIFIEKEMIFPWPALSLGRWPEVHIR